MSSPSDKNYGLNYISNTQKCILQVKLQFWRYKDCHKEILENPSTALIKELIIKNAHSRLKINRDLRANNYKQIYIKDYLNL